MLKFWSCFRVGLVLVVSVACKTTNNSKVSSDNDYTILKPVVENCQQPQYFPAWRIQKDGQESLLVADPETPFKFFMGKELIDSFLAKPRYVRMVDLNAYISDGTIPVEAFSSNLGNITSYYIENLIWTKFQADSSKQIVNVLDHANGLVYLNSKGVMGQDVLEKTYGSTLQDSFAVQSKIAAMHVALYMGDEGYLKREFPRLHSFSDAWKELQQVIPNVQQAILNIAAKGEAAFVLPLDMIYGNEEMTLLEKLEAGGYSVKSFYGSTGNVFAGSNSSCSVQVAQALKKDSLLQSLAPGGAVSSSCGKVGWPLLWEVENANGQTSTILGTEHYVNPLLIDTNVINKVLSRKEIWFETEMSKFLQDRRAGLVKLNPEEPKEFVEYSFGNVLFDEYLYRLASQPELSKDIKAFNDWEDHQAHASRAGFSAQVLEEKMQAGISVQKLVEQMLEREELTKVLLRGQIQEANDMLGKNIKNNPKLAALLTRDEAWEKPFVEAVNKGDSAFVVGYAHVAGGHPSSLLNVAKRNGFKVRRVPIKACNSAL